MLPLKRELGFSTNPETELSTFQTSISSNNGQTTDNPTRFQNHHNVFLQCQPSPAAAEWYLSRYCTSPRNCCRSIFGLGQIVTVHCPRVALVPLKIVNPKEREGESLSESHAE
ncbi:hypothetical protein CEXT_519331 [Caerostris extrusa]|uniref:Uncharacterized protein n=1 Tax=Caerostris extrusa TaxID=172846 RepID=A0AAV4THW2_CAEEX|nr:hypothetical protein CEXT_519331 [Caerostris extrusa]